VFRQALLGDAGLLDARSQDAQELSERGELAPAAREQPGESREVTHLLDAVFVAEIRGALRDPALETTTLGVERKGPRVAVRQRVLGAGAVGVLAPLELVEQAVDVVSD